ncbi:MAG: hypothetical protein MOB07_20890 [Acidobacteria bacterium]|nr:hypothetical protein [Acidobacteriota bacterium]
MGFYLRLKDESYLGHGWITYFYEPPPGDFGIKSQEFCEAEEAYAISKAALYTVVQLREKFAQGQMRWPSDVDNQLATTAVDPLQAAHEMLDRYGELQRLIALAIKVDPVYVCHFCKCGGSDLTPNGIDHLAQIATEEVRAYIQELGGSFF